MSLGSRNPPLYLSPLIRPSRAVQRYLPYPFFSRVSSFSALFRAIPCCSVANFGAVRIRGAADHLAKRDGYDRWLIISRSEMATPTVPLRQTSG
jgi:hypothetical protein